MSQDQITYQQERDLLGLLSAVHPGPYECASCGVEITAATGWKPLVLLIGGERKVGIDRCVVLIECGTCPTIRAVVENGAQA